MRSWSRGARRRHGSTRRSALALLAVVVASLVGPADVTAVSQSWSITTDASAVPSGVPTDVVVTVRNTSSDNGGSKSIGCVRIAIPSAFAVASATVTSVTSGFSWSVTTTPTSGTLVQAVAADDHDRLNGSPDDDVLVLTLGVIGIVEGTYDWTADEFEKPDCTQSHDQQVQLPMAIGVAGNSAPVAYGDAATVHHTGTVNVAAPGLLANDVDPEGGALTALLNTPPASGSATVDPDGSWTYDPGAGFVGLDEFTYRVSDGSAVSAPATVVVHVTDDAPAPSDDTYTAAKNVTLTAAGAVGVLANDSDPDGDPLSVALETPPANGAVVLGADGSFQYTPAEGWVGVETFTYRASDGAQTAVATVTVDVRNSAPAPGDDAYAASRNGLLVVPAATGLLANDVDENGDLLAATLETTPTHGVVEVATDGSFTYTPAPGYTGADGFTYRASDGDAATLAAVTLTVTNGAPAAAADTASVVHDRVLGVAAPGVLANDADPNGDALAASLATPPVHGTVTLASDGGYVYVPHDGYVGGDAFTYTATDGGGGSSTATVTIEVTNAAPVTEDEVHAVQKNLGLTVPAPGVLANDADPDGDELQASLAVAPGHGIAVVGTDGAWTYTPDQGFVGTDSFAYEVTDGFVGTLGTVTLIVSNDGPATADDAWAGWRNGSITVAAPGVLGNDGDPNGDPLTATVAAAPGHGTVTMGTDGSFVYTPDAGFTGSDAFTYDATDGAMASRATVQLDVVNRAPVAAADRYTVLHDRPLTVAAGDGLLGNDADADGDSLVVALTSLPRHGSLALQPDGAFAYEPHPAYTGTDAFTYTVSDGLANHAAVVEILVENRAPVPGADRYTVEAGATLQVNGPGVLANDVDGDGDNLIVSAVYAAAHGNVQMSTDGGFTYTPQQGFTGTDAFAYIVSDGVATSDGVVTIEVVAPPVVATPPAPTPSPSAPPATPGTPAPATPVTETPGPTPVGTPTPTPSAAPTTQPPPTSTPDPVLESPSPVPPSTPSPGVETPTTVPSATPSPTAEPSPSVPPAASSPPPGGDQFFIPTGGSDGVVDVDVTLAAAALGTLGLLLWAVPGLFLSVPGILVVVAVVIQMTGGLIWMPLIRRRIAPAAVRWPTAPAQ